MSLRYVLPFLEKPKIEKLLYFFINFILDTFKI